MILYRTKLFGFYDESGKLLEKYTKGPAKKRFEKWKKELVDDLLKARVSVGGIKYGDLDKSILDKYLVEQSRSRDIQAKLVKGRKMQSGRDLIEKKRKILEDIIKQGPKTPDYEEKLAQAYDKLQDSIDSYHWVAAGNRIEELYKTPGKEFIDPNHRLSNIVKDSPDYDSLKRNILNLQREKELDKETIDKLTSENNILGSTSFQLNKTIEDLNNTINDNKAKIEGLSKINDKNNKIIQDLENTDARNREKIDELDKSKKNWMLGTGIASALGVLGTGAGFAYGSNKNNKKKELK